MMAGGIHDVETMRLLIGEISSVSALRARPRFVEMEGDDTSIALVRFAEATVGTLVESFVTTNLGTASGAEVRTLRIDGDVRSLVVRNGHSIHPFSERPEFRLVGAVAQYDLYVPLADTFELEIAHVLSCLRTGQEPLTSGRRQRRALEGVLAAYASMASDVTLPQRREKPRGAGRAGGIGAGQAGCVRDMRRHSSSPFPLLPRHVTCQQSYDRCAASC